MHRRGLIVLCLSLMGCAAGPAVLTSEALPIKHVVLYRNGVGYFERAGRFDGEQLQFQVRQSEVGDFLSSLTVIERARGRVRSVSFDVPDPPVAAPPSIQPPVGPPGLPVPPPPPPTPPPDPSGPRVDVNVRLDGQRHDMTVAYVVAAPIWRPSYRVVLDDHGALLQAWAVVQNISGEDWSDVRLSLTSGAPLAFQSDLGNPVTPERPIVTDTGEVVTAIPASETAMAQGPEGGPPVPPPSAPASSPEEAQSEALGDESDDGVGLMGSGSGGGGYGPRVTPQPTRSAGRRMARSRAPMGQAAPSPPPSFTAQQAQGSVAAMAAVAVLGAGVTRYDIDRPLTIPDGGSTMVAVLSGRVPGEEAHLYAPDPGVPSSNVHPFRVARVENRTGAMLERGPISVLARGAFLGQGLLDALPRGATAFVPFAVDRSVAVESSQTWGEASARLIRATRESVTIERFSTRTTTYVVRNGGSEPVRVYVRHVRQQGANIHEPPDGTEMTALNALVPIRAGARGRAEVVIEERSPVERVVDFMAEPASEAIGLYLQGSAIDAAAGPALRRALEIRRELLAATQRLNVAMTERAELERNAEETRQNLEAIRRLARAADLRERLVRRLTELDERIATLTRSVVEDQTNQSELRVRLSEALQDVTLVVPRTSTR